MSDNGLVRPDPAILTPNDLKRAKVALGGRSPHELLAEPETMFEVLIYCIRTRTDPAFTFEQAGDTPLGEVFDMSGDSPPPIPSPAMPGASGGNSGGPSSRKRPTGSGNAPSSASTTASAAPSTTP